MVGKRISLDKNIPASPAASKELSANLERTALCSFFAMGKCLRGKECKFAHDASQIRPKPDLIRTSLCHDFMRKGSCKNGDKCKYAHGEAQLRQNKEQILPKQNACVVMKSTLLWDPLGLDMDMPAAKESTPISALIPVLQRLMGKRKPSIPVEVGQLGCVGR